MSGAETDMKRNQLTQEDIDLGTNNHESKNGLYATVAKHPVLAGGAVLVGAGLAYAAVRIIKTASEGEEVARDAHIETSITIDRSPAELFAFWRDFRNLPLFMTHLESVIELDGGITHWVAKGVGGGKVEWDAELYNEKENELIAWRSLEDADVVNAGSVRFERAPRGHGTYVRIRMNYNPPAGKVGEIVAKALGSDPLKLIKGDLRRFKQLMEAGEIATIDGQPSGRAADAEPVSESSESRISSESKELANSQSV